MAWDDPTVVRTYPDAISAHVARTRLEAEGIEAFVVDENQVTNDPLLAIAVGGVKLVVRQRTVDKAREILDRPLPAHEPECPECGSRQVQVSKAGRRSAFLTVLLLGIPIGRVG